MKKRMKKNINKKEVDKTVRQLNNLFQNLKDPINFHLLIFNFHLTKKDFREH